MDINFDGLNGENPPVKVLYTQKTGGKNVILFPGASPHAEEHPRMVMLGAVLAKNGYKVYIPRIPPLKMLDISEINVQWFHHFYHWLLTEEKVESFNTAMVGLSYGGGIMLKALLKMQKENNIPKSILTYGTYSNAESLIKFLITGEIIINKKSYTVVPHEWGLIVIFQNFLKNLDLDWDTSGVEKAIELQIQEKFEEQNAQIQKLPEFQKQLVRSINKGEATEEVTELAQAIIKNEQKTFRNLSPKDWCNKIQKKIFVLHGANDSMVPFTESIQLSKYLPNYELLITHIWEHKEVSTHRSIFFNTKEVFKLIWFYAKFFDLYEN